MQKMLFLPLMALGLLFSVDFAAANGPWFDKFDPGYRGAPGPIAGAGLPLLLVAGGVYWAVRRYRRNSRQDA